MASNMAAIKAAHIERRKATEELRAIYDSATDAKGNALPLTAEQRQAEDRLGARIEEMEKREKALIDMGADEERSSGAASAFWSRHGSLATVPVPGSTEVRSVVDLIEGRSNSVDFEARDLSSITSTDGVELVPTITDGSIISYIVQSDPALAAMRTFMTPGGAPFKLPRATAYGVAAIVAEGGTIGESDPQFDLVTFGAHKAAFLTQVPSELDQDNVTGLAQWLIEQGGRALGRGVAAGAITGSGSSAPAGLDLHTVGKTCAAAAAVTFDELIDVQHSVAPDYRREASWVIHDDTLKAVRKLKNSDGDYIWQPSTVAGHPDVLLGRPCYISPNMAPMGAGNVFGAFGDLAAGHGVRYAGGARLERSSDVDFEKDLISFRFIQRFDAQILDTHAIRTIKSAAS